MTFWRASEGVHLNHVRSAVKGLKKELREIESTEFDNDNIQYAIMAGTAQALVDKWFPVFSHSIELTSKEADVRLEQSDKESVSSVETKGKSASYSVSSEPTKEEGQYDNLALHLQQLNFIPLDDNDTGADFEGCYFVTTPYCKKHGAMNRVSDDGIWRCLRTDKTPRCRTACKSLSQPSVAFSRDAEQASEKDSVEGTGQHGVSAGELSGERKSDISASRDVKHSPRKGFCSRCEHLIDDDCKCNCHNRGGN